LAITFIKKFQTLNSATGTEMSGLRDWRTILEDPWSNFRSSHFYPVISTQFLCSSMTGVLFGCITFYVKLCFFRKKKKWNFWVKMIPKILAERFSFFFHSTYYKN